MYLKSEKIQNYLSKIRENDKASKNRFFEDSLCPIKIIENFMSLEDDKENKDPNLPISIDKDDIDIVQEPLKSKFNKRRVFKELFVQDDEMKEE